MGLTIISKVPISIGKVKQSHILNTDWVQPIKTLSQTLFRYSQAKPYIKLSLGSVKQIHTQTLFRYSQAKPFLALSRDVECGFCCGFMPPARTLLSRSWLLTVLPGRFIGGSSPLARCFSRVFVSLTPLLARAVALTLLLARATKNFFSRGALTAPR